MPTIAISQSLSVHMGISFVNQNVLTTSTGTSEHHPAWVFHRRVKIHMRVYIRDTAPAMTNADRGLYLIMCWSPFWRSTISSLKKKYSSLSDQITWHIYWIHHTKVYFKQDVFMKHNAPIMANSNEGQDHKEIYFDTSRKILSFAIWKLQYTILKKL